LDSAHVIGGKRTLSAPQIRSALNVREANRRRDRHNRFSGVVELGKGYLMPNGYRQVQSNSYTKHQTCPFKQSSA
jgi:hypothetical protein